MENDPRARHETAARSALRRVAVPLAFAAGPIDVPPVRRRGLRSHAIVIRPAVVTRAARRLRCVPVMQPRRRPPVVLAFGRPAQVGVPSRIGDGGRGRHRRGNSHGRGSRDRRSRGRRRSRIRDRRRRRGGGTSSNRGSGRGRGCRRRGRGRRAGRRHARRTERGPARGWARAGGYILRGDSAVVGNPVRYER
jgi:hypothetical protein